MAIKRPLCAFASDQLKEMTDDELDNLSYNFRVKSINSVGTSSSYATANITL